MVCRADSGQRTQTEKGEHVFRTLSLFWTFSSWESWGIPHNPIVGKKHQTNGCPCAFGGLSPFNAEEQRERLVLGWLAGSTGKLPIVGVERACPRAGRSPNRNYVSNPPKLLSCANTKSRFLIVRFFSARVGGAPLSLHFPSSIDHQYLKRLAGFVSAITNKTPSPASKFTVPSVNC